VNRYCEEVVAQIDTFATRTSTPTTRRIRRRSKCRSKWTHLGFTM